MNDRVKKTELLAPAGDLEAVKAALANGADAVYLGVGNFHARAKAGFGPEDLRTAVRLATLYGARIHAAFNTLIADSEMDQVLRTADEAVEAGIHAIIVQDLGLSRLFRKRYPSIELHASTQMGIHNVYGARMLKELGFNRAILARETPISEIRKIAEEIETEVFVQGALCVCFSGNCYLSSAIFSASGNRGKCLQSCRKRYVLKQGEKTLKEGYLLSMSDLCLLGYLDELKAAGVRSLKIEGRLRRKEYVAGVVRAYRKALDGEEPEDLNELKKLFNRGDYTCGHAFGAETKDLISSEIQGHKGVRWGRIKKLVGETLICEGPAYPGDGFKVFRKQGEHLTEVGSAICHETGQLRGSKGLKAGDLLFLTSDQRQLESLRKYPKPSVDLVCRLSEGNPAVLELKTRAGDQQVAVSVEGAVVLPATGNGLTEEQVRNPLSKLNDTLFQLGSFHLENFNKIFSPVSALNELRRKGIRALEEALDRVRPDPVIRSVEPEYPKPAEGREGTVILYRPGQLPKEVGAAATALVLKPSDLKEDPGIDFPEKTFLFLPAYTSEKDLALAKDYILKVGLKGVWVNQLSQVYWAEEGQIPYYCGLGMNVFNGQTVAYFQDRALCAGIALSNELNLKQLDPLMKLDKVLLYAYGRPEVMTLRHCPVQQGYGKDCAHCQYREGLTLTDEKGAVFPFSRMKMRDCTFFLHNSLAFSAFKAVSRLACGVVLDFTSPGAATVSEIWNFYQERKAGGNPVWNWPATSGNLNRGV